MRILFLAPQPFYQDRGTPIAIDLVLKTLSERGEKVDLVTYHEGQDREYANIQFHRIEKVPGVRNIGLGFSWKKVVCDFFLFWKAFSLITRKRYDLIHAVEESVFIAMLFKLFFRIPYIYDMDSSLVDQILQKFESLKFLRRPLSFFEAAAARHARAVIPVCDSLALLAESYGAKKITVLPDVSLLSCDNQLAHSEIRNEIHARGPLLLYVGNLEKYQGIDLMLESFERVIKQSFQATLVIIGGSAGHINFYSKKTKTLGIESSVFFLGPRSPEYLGAYLTQADILISPRIQGTNTPMKIYSYLHSGKPVLATDLATHRQVMNEEIAFLSSATIENFSEGMICLIENFAMRAKLGEAGKRFIEEKYTFASFKTQLNHLYDELDSQITPARPDFSIPKQLKLSKTA
jgi:glycosyltransferase involved in cell wall biosynthesis